MKKNIDTVIFDIGAVLVSERGPREIFANFGLQDKEYAAWQEYKVGKCDEMGYWQKTLKDTRLEGQEKDLAQAFRVLNGACPPGPAYPLVGRLERNGYRLAILSNHAHEWARRITKNLDLEGRCDPIIISEEVGLAKPDRAIYELILGKLGRNPEQCVFIDDKLKNIIAARDMGIKGVHLQLRPYTDHKDRLLQVEADLQALGVNYR